MHRASPSGEQHEQWLDNGLAMAWQSHPYTASRLVYRTRSRLMPASVAGALCARAAFLLLHMPWYGALLWQRDADGLRICCQYDHDRRGWELPKGGHQLGRRASSGVPDSSPFATARHEMWEEAGVWLAWRPPGAYDWVTEKGEPLPGGPGLHQNAFIVTELSTEDEQGASTDRRRLNLEECWRLLCQDHLDVVLTRFLRPKAC
jgi:8-oxo-dGTP pyrophosphatase MutT (NUDIX family)